MIPLPVRVAALALSATACLPDQRCDPGYAEDHGACYPTAPSIDAGSLLDAASSEAGASNPSATFGSPCASDRECGGDAPTCAAPQLPYCTALNCMGRSDACPARWTCLDARGVSPVPGVDSICLRL